ncbi:PTS glucitol/sorbitol transporter subunit IIA [Streptococcus equi subsp. zooepidemicus]|uniref:PTS glucitol/sorbitol transporter subunit IIA n=1 Tax=Streptococcus equi TaxID=1336 RepID=UPI0024A8D259|nr:PTS glucitol/sorbitol transporter subunit IIA [Streptococcus equi]MDI6044795.1 PTS glucitol/sorbitol transporter subunit IIA [Streptococcus equi subsp. zooepidemicus]HEL0024990.1 PTS glucitol/sorbitol transporter subunit IIA [Streptococcus equi subsp. zooepidemicus]HEL1223035.1 PTS glucitol/sorbitol transporter subunit IIA [Streptococcus equi subsp. zooepidemicus]
MIKVFETRVTAIGSEAADMINAANMLILFGQGAPADLADFCYTIDNKQVSGPISVGGQLVIDQMAYDITAVGAVVEKNLAQLGHITISFNGSTASSLPGTLHVKGKGLPQVRQGSLVQIFA